MENYFNQIIDRVSEWLKFAEGKHAILIGFNGAAIFAIISILLNDVEIPIPVFYYLLYVCSMLLFSMITSLISFVPMLVKPENNNKYFNLDISKRNLLYFGDLASLEYDQLIERFAAITKFNKKNITYLHKYYAEQIINNSRIALRKYKLFSISIWFDLFGVFPPLATIYLFVRRRKGLNND